MNIKFVVGGVVVIGALFLGTEIYWKKQFEQKARDDFKSLSFLKPMNDVMAKANLPLKVDALNHYPHVLVYADFTQDLPNTVNKTAMQAEMRSASHQMSCGYFDYVREKEATEKYKDVGQGIVTVVEEDQLAMTHIFKSRLGEVMHEQKQILSQCPEFIELKKSVE